MRVYLDFDGVVHRITDEFHKQMSTMSDYFSKGKDYFNDFRNIVEYLVIMQYFGWIIILNT